MARQQHDEYPAQDPLLLAVARAEVENIIDELEYYSEHLRKVAPQFEHPNTILLSAKCIRVADALQRQANQLRPILEEK